MFYFHQFRDWSLRVSTNIPNMFKKLVKHERKMTDNYWCWENVRSCIYVPHGSFVTYLVPQWQHHFNLFFCLFISNMRKVRSFFIHYRFNQTTIKQSLHRFIFFILFLLCHSFYDWQWRLYLCLNSNLLMNFSCLH